MQTSDRTPISEQETRPTKALAPRGWRRKRAIEERDTQVTQHVGGEKSRNSANQGAFSARSFARQRAQGGRSVYFQEPQRRRRRGLIILALALLVLACLGILLGPPLA